MVITLQIQYNLTLTFLCLSLVIQQFSIFYTWLLTYSEEEYNGPKETKWISIWKKHTKWSFAETF